MVMITMFACGLVYPTAAAISGIFWVVGRFVYGFGYALGNPKLPDARWAVESFWRLPSHNHGRQDRIRCTERAKQHSDGERLCEVALRGRAVSRLQHCFGPAQACVTDSPA